MHTKITLSRVYNVLHHHFHTFDTRGATAFTKQWIIVLLLDLINNYYVFYLLNCFDIICNKCWN